MVILVTGEGVFSSVTSITLSQRNLEMSGIVQDRNVRFSLLVRTEDGGGCRSNAYIGLCYNSGHENVQGTYFRMLEEFGRRLITVHIHDNEGSDTHVLPYEGSINWEQFRSVFPCLDYSGNLPLKVDIKHSQFAQPAAFLSEARTRAEKLLQPPDLGGG